MERILITGGSGFLATHALLKLLKQGHPVRVTVRGAEKKAFVEKVIVEHAPLGGSTEIVEADLLQDAGWAQAMEGCGGVFHMASPFPLKTPKDPQVLIRPAVEGTQRVIRAAAAAGIRKVVLTSSCAAVSYGKGGREEGAFTEEDWTDPDSQDTTPYIRSKTLAERAAWDLVADECSQVKLTAINPGLVLGPLLGRSYGGSVELVWRMMAGEMPAAPHVGFNIADVRDVADLHYLALTNGSTDGQRYICADSWMWFRDLGRMVKEAYPDIAVNSPTGSVPSWLVRLVALFDDELKQILIELDQKRVVDTSKAQKELGWKPRPAEDSVRETCESLVRYGLV